jgi:hypothetical protein
LIWKAVCEEGKVENIEQFGGGYGKGYVRALERYCQKLCIRGWAHPGFFG